MSVRGYGSPSINIVYGDQNAPYSPPYHGYQAPQQHRPPHRQPNSRRQQSVVPPSSQPQREQQPPATMQDVLAQLNQFLAVVTLQLQPREQPAPPQQNTSGEQQGTPSAPASAANAGSGEQQEVQPVPTQAPAVLATTVSPVAAASPDVAALAVEDGSEGQYGRRQVPAPAQQRTSVEQQNSTRPDEARTQVDISSQPGHVLPETVVQQISPSSPPSPSAASAGDKDIATNRRGPAPYHDQDRHPPALPETPNLSGSSQIRLGPSMRGRDASDPGTSPSRMLADPPLGQRHTREAKNRLHAQQESVTREPDYSGYGFQPRRGRLDTAPISSEPSPH
ncbi:MAG: hypothetical protein LQ341_004033 [Variospora aurantia]|nr:MAG: hypothetical protein LQ341_004033 [Variospora aurantia]